MTDESHMSHRRHSISSIATVVVGVGDDEHHHGGTNTSTAAAAAAVIANNDDDNRMTVSNTNTKTTSSSFLPFEIEEPVSEEEDDGMEEGGDSALIHPLVPRDNNNNNSNSNSNSNDDDDDDNDNDNNYDNKEQGRTTRTSTIPDTTGTVGTATTPQVIINIIISFVGAGLLGVPNAFSKSGWLLGSIALLTVSALNVYAMLCLPQVQQELQSRQQRQLRQQQQQHPVHQQSIESYGDLGRIILGPKGEKLIFVCLGISQAGFATAYIIFIAANLNSIFGDVLSRFTICLACIPGLMGLVQFQELKSLSPFSMVANLANFCALSAVLLQDYEHYTPHNDTIQQWNTQGLLYVIAVTIYSMEGVGLVLSLKSSCKPGNVHTKFSSTLITTLTCISIFMIIFGSAGYWAFGTVTLAPITLNLANHWSATFVKGMLCLGLYLTYPIMMFPIWNILESESSNNEDGDNNNNDSSTINNTRRQRNRKRKRFLVRTSVVCVSVLIAYMVPNFGHFLSFVGSSICTALAFVFPSYFHLYVFWYDSSSSTSMPLHQKIIDIFLLFGGFLFGCMGTYQSIVSMMIHGELDDE